MKISRRDFLGTAAITGAATLSGETSMPTRILGRTGARVSILAMGGGSRFLMYHDEDKALEALNRAFDLGISYMDTAYSYGNGLSEERVGKVMKTRRKEIFLATKIDARKGDDARRIVEGGLKRMQTDHLDLIHVHSLTDEQDLAAVEAPDGVLNALLKLRDEKVTRFVGITSHTDPVVLKTALERHDFDCTQMALNAARVGHAQRQRRYGSESGFENQLRRGGLAGGAPQKVGRDCHEDLRARGAGRPSASRQAALLSAVTPRRDFGSGRDA